MNYTDHRERIEQKATSDEGAKAILAALDAIEAVPATELYRLVAHVLPAMLRARTDELPQLEVVTEWDDEWEEDVTTVRFEGKEIDEVYEADMAVRWNSGQVDVDSKTVDIYAESGNFETLTFILARGTEEVPVRLPEGWKPVW